MIELQPWLRAYRIGDDPFLESVLEERSVPLDPLLLDVLRALARGPVASSAELLERLGADPGEKGAVHARLSQLLALRLVAVDAAPRQSDLWARLAEGTPELPAVDQVELTNICPMTCTMCPTGTGRVTRAKGHMDLALFEKLAREIAGAQTKPLTLHNLGESLLHPRVADAVAIARGLGHTTELSANPGHLPVDLYRALAAAGLDRLVLSVDGTDAETLTAIRGKGARAAQAFENLEALFAERRARRGGPRILVQLVRQAKNAHQAAAFLARFGALGLEGVSAYVKELDANTLPGPDALYEIGRPKRPYLCRAPWRAVVVLWNGDVVPCCHDYDGAVVLGNLGTQSLREIWSGPAAQALRARLGEGRVAAGEPCGGCAHRADRYSLPPLDEIPEEPLHW